MRYNLQIHWNVGYLNGTARAESTEEYKHIKRPAADSDEMIAQCLNCTESPEWCNKHCAHLNERRRKERFIQTEKKRAAAELKAQEKARAKAERKTKLR